MSEEGGNIEVNNPGCYPTVCVELSIDCFAVNTVLQVRMKGKTENTAASPHFWLLWCLINSLISNHILFCLEKLSPKCPKLLLGGNQNFLSFKSVDINKLFKLGIPTYRLHHLYSFQIVVFSFSPFKLYEFFFQSAHINDFEGGSVTGVSFDSMPQVRTKLSNNDSPHAL